MSELRVELEVDLRRGDLFRGFLRTIALYGAGARLLPIVVVLVALVAGDAAYLLSTGRPLEVHHLGFGIAFLVITSVFTVALHVLSGRMLASLPTTRASYVVDDEEGVSVEAAGRRERLPFSAFEGAAKTGAAYYLYTSRTAFRILPRRELSEAQRDVLEKILVRRLPKAPKAPGGRWVTFAAAVGLGFLFLMGRGH
ncbi:MAG: YcxB family protein [Myxococcales bacterium]|jgi:hypothetical protein|nr:YcxB family protein [Myxococcales bacterium]